MNWFHLDKSLISDKFFVRFRRRAAAGNQKVTAALDKRSQ